MKFSWILINKFAIGMPITLETEKEFLKKQGIKTILDLRNSEDLSKINHQDYIENLSGFEYKNVQLPDHKSGRFSETFEIRKAVDLLHSSLAEGTVFMHCHAAIERSPLVSIAYLHLKKNFSIIQSCDYVKQQNQSTCINLEQLKYIK